MKNIISKLLNSYGPSGREDIISNTIREIIMPFVDEVKTDAMGNLIAIKRGSGTRIMLAAHMDQIGFIVTDIDDNGFLRVFNVGGIHVEASINRRVVFENGINGIISHEEEGFDLRDKTTKYLYIDIGATSKEDALKAVSIGDVAVYAPDISWLMNDTLMAPALDNRIGCAVLIETLRQIKETNNEVYAVFTVQEELGLRGARAAAFDINPEIAIAIDVTIAGDTPKGHKIAIKLGDGPCIKIMDRSLVCSPRVVNLLIKSAQDINIPVQREVLTAGGTDAGAIQLTRGGVTSGVISIPCRYVHTACEMISFEDAENAAALIAKTVANI